MKIKTIPVQGLKKAPFEIMVLPLSFSLLLLVDISFLAIVVILYWTIGNFREES